MLAASPSKADALPFTSRATFRALATSIELMNESSFAIAVEDDLLTRARQGDRAAQSEIYERFEKPVFTLAFRLCQSHDEAQDAMQDCFLNVFRRLHQFKGTSPFWGWLRQVAINTTLQRLRQKKRFSLRFVFGGEAQEHTHAVSANSGDQLDLSQALRALSPTARSVVWLHDVEGLTHGEIAESMGKSVSFSKSQLARAHKRLREHLNEHEVKRCNPVALTN